MSTTDNENSEFENNKSIVISLAEEDGKLVSPIDLSLENTKHLELDRLRWMNFDNRPVKMKLTNTGETVIISGKWSVDRPYLCGGPLDGNYVFSQVHFHWGSDEHEGSEHTVRGISYPMEIHAVFYKTRYITQESALKKEDGIIIVVFLVKLQDRTTPGLEWLASHLDKVIQPQTFASLPLSPLSTLLVPFTKDYLLYWGLVESQRCSHTMLWFVSRAAFSISVEHLNMFRKLLNSCKEPMNKNFRGASPNQGRSVFHVNPSSENKHLLLPGTVDPPHQAVIVNYSQMEPLDYVQAQQIFNKGDSIEDEIKKETGSYKIKSVNSSSKTYTFCEGIQREKSDSMVRTVERGRSSGKAISQESCSHFTNGSNARSVRCHLNKEDSLHKSKSQKRKHVLLRKSLERQRRQGFEKMNKLFDANENLEVKLGTVINKSYSNCSLNQLEICNFKQEPNEKLDENNNETNVSENNCQPDITSQMINSSEHVQKTTLDLTETENLVGKQPKAGETLYRERPKGKKLNSRLPIKSGFQSSLAPLFSQSKPVQEQKIIKSNHYSPFRFNCDVKKPTMTIPRPIGRNAEKIEESCGIHNVRPLTRPTSSTRPSQHKKNK